MSRDDRISVSKDGGVEPHITLCEVCGEGYGVTVGVMYAATYFDNGRERRVYVDRSRVREATREAERKGIEMSAFKHVPVDEKGVTLGICEACDGKQQADYDEAIAACMKGGVLFRCSECDARGFIPYKESTASFCDEVRKGNGVEFGKPSGVEFDSCAQHDGE
tara:strand:- start:8378 stop:8869 length:492 start_codon:yes stop_codon:yes gene_type:complete